MSNVIEFRSRQSSSVEWNSPEGEAARFSILVKQAAMRANAREALSLLADQFERAMQHARAIEPKMRDLQARQEFGDRIEFVQRLLDVARLKILQL